MYVFGAQKNDELRGLRLIVSEQQSIVQLTIAVEIGVDEARISLWEMLDDERLRIGVEFLQGQQLVAGKPTQNTFQTVLLLLATRRELDTAEKGDAPKLHTQNERFLSCV